MIPDTAMQAIRKSDAKRQADAVRAAPVKFNVLAPMFFRGQRVERGDAITATIEEAVELYGGFRSELADPADLWRIRETAAEAAAVHAKGARRNLPSWIKGGATSY